jgi:hypothetical protein
MFKPLLIFFTILAFDSGVATAQAAVRVEIANLGGPRPLQQQTADAAIRDYLQSWQSLQSALGQNRADLLDQDFVGDARDKLGKTIQEQAALSMLTRYQDSSHDLQIVFYSPEGLSIELTDNVEYDVELQDHGKLETRQHVRARYIAVLTPSDSRWRVRILQALPE